MDQLAVVSDDELTAVRLLVHRAHHAIDEGHCSDRLALGWHGAPREGKWADAFTATPDPISSSVAGSAGVILVMEECSLLREGVR
jgi:hypothetical protein